MRAVVSRRSAVDNHGQPECEPAVGGIERCAPNKTQMTPEYPGSSRNVVQLSVNFSIGGVRCDVKLLGGDYLCVLSPDRLLHRWENGPGGIRTRICALTESSATVAPRALTEVSADK